MVCNHGFPPDPRICRPAKRSAGRGLICSSMLLAALAASPLHAQEPVDPALSTLMQKWSETTLELKQYSIDHRHQALIHARSALAAADEALDTLKARTQREWDGLSDESRNKRTDILKMLQARRDDLDHWYQDLENGSEKSWDQVRDGFADAYEGITVAMTDAIHAFYED